jgi:hypothetical protein
MSESQPSDTETPTWTITLITPDDEEVEVANSQDGDVIDLELFEEIRRPFNVSEFLPSDYEDLTFNDREERAFFLERIASLDVPERNARMVEIMDETLFWAREALTLGGEYAGVVRVANDCILNFQNHVRGNQEFEDLDLWAWSRSPGEFELQECVKWAWRWERDAKEYIRKIQVRHMGLLMAKGVSYESE